MVRVYTDGIFDLFHYGHSQYFKRIREMFSDSENVFLMVGISSDKETASYKGYPPIMTLVERSTVVSDCKYVDQVLSGAPWELTEEFIEHNKIDWVVHEDIPYTMGAKDGSDVYSTARKLGKFKHMERTPSISTSDIKKRVIRNAQAIICNLEKRSKDNQN
jgi:choline-phosphate cytidylyltransferase